MFAFLAWAVPIVVIIVTVYIGVLGARFYVDEVLRDKDGDA